MADANVISQTMMERKLYDYPGKARSRVWKFFGFEKFKEGPPTKENLEMSRAICRLCGKCYINKGNTTNFQAHLDHDHHAKDDASVCLKPAKTKLRTVDNESQNNPLVQPKLSFAPARMSSDRQNVIDDALLRLLVGKVLPMSLVDNKLFSEIAGHLDQRYKVPSRRVVMRKLEGKQDEMRKKVISDVKSLDSISIAHDGWTSMNTESYNTVTGHLIDSSWNLKTVVLETKKMEGQHTSEKIAQSLLNTKKRGQLPTPMATTDNAANERKAFRILGWDRFGCYGHRINLIVRNAMSLPDVSKVLGKGRKLVTFFHSSSSVTDQLANKQKLLLPEKVGHKLIIDVPTRWNSTLAMLERLCEQTPAIAGLGNDENVTKAACATIRNCAYTFEEQSMVERLVMLLKSFEKATTILCAEQVPTMHKVLPVVVKLTKCLDESEDDPSLIKSLKSKMREELTNRTETEDIALVACALNPYTKDFQFMPTMRSEAHALLKKVALDTTYDHVKVKQEVPDTENLPPLPNLPNFNISVDDKVAPAEAPVEKKMKFSDTEDWLNDVICVGDV